MSVTSPPRIAVALISAAVLGYELLLLALFSLVQWHHFAYLVVSVALLGFGASGSFLVFVRARLAGHFRGFAAGQAGLFGLTSLASFALAQRLSFNPEELVWDPAHWLRLALVILLLTLPFFFAANLIGLALAEYRQRQARVYAADLAGAGSGALLMIGLLYLLAPAEALLVVALLGFAAAAVAWLESGGRAAPAVAGLAAILLLGTQLPRHWIEPQISPYKELSQLLRVSGTRVIAERHGPLGSLAVVESQTIPLRHAPGLSLAAKREPPAQLGLFANAGAMSAITRFRGDRAELAYLDQLTSALPYHLSNAGRVLVLGAGGGAEVLQALYHDARHIDAVEINPQVIELVRDRFGEFSGQVYRHERVRVHHASARGFLQRSTATYDLIQVPALDSFASAGTGLHGLNENFVYTIEALAQAFSRLDEDGIVALTRWVRLPPRDNLKLFATAIEALERSGIEDAGRHLVMIRGLQTATLLIHRRAPTAADIQSLAAFSRERLFDLAYYPGMPPQQANRYNQLDEAYFYQGAQALLGSERERFLGDYKFSLEPASDDRPFHFHFAKWSSFAELVALRHRGGSALLETGYLTLVITLLLALLLSLLLILLPLALVAREASPVAVGFAKSRVFAYFGALGLGFLLLEIAFLQKFILLLHHPLLAAAVVLASFLLAAGAGSAFAQRFSGKPGARRVVVYAIATIIVLGLLYLLLLGSIMQAAVDWPLAARVLLSVGLILPLGFCMGMPFPLGLGAIQNGPAALTPWAWGINGCASVISAVLATLLAIHQGFSTVIMIALICYAVATLGYPRPAGGRAGEAVVETTRG